MNLLNLDADKFKQVEVRGHKFRIKFMSPMDRVQITQKRMNLQNGNPISSMTDADFIFFENIAVVDVCTDEFPKEFKANESCLKWDDIDLINDLAKEIRDHTAEIEQKLKKNKPAI